MRLSKPALVPPGFIEPCLPVVGVKPPSGDGWIHEIKHDDYRLQVQRRNGRVRLFTRRGFDWTHRFPWIVESAAKLKVTSVTLDGEAVCCRDDGIPDFDALHSQAHDQKVCLMAFDLMELNGEDWCGRPLIERKSKLSRLLARARPGLRYVDHLEGDGALIFKHACRLGLKACR